MPSPSDNPCPVCRALPGKPCHDKPGAQGDWTADGLNIYHTARCQERRVEDGNPINIKMGAELGAQLLDKLGAYHATEVLCSAICFVSEVTKNRDIVVYASNWLDSFVALDVAESITMGSVQDEVDAIIVKGTKADAFETQLLPGLSVTLPVPEFVFHATHLWTVDRVGSPAHCLRCGMTTEHKSLSRGCFEPKKEG